MAGSVLKCRASISLHVMIGRMLIDEKVGENMLSCGDTYLLQAGQRRLSFCNHWEGLTKPGDFSRSLAEKMIDGRIQSCAVPSAYL